MHIYDNSNTEGYKDKKFLLLPDIILLPKDNHYQEFVMESTRFVSYVCTNIYAYPT